MPSSQQLSASYKAQLTSRFYSNSIALEVLICLIMIFILIIELVKFAKKTYEWQTEYEVNLEQKYADQSKQMLKEKSHLESLDIRALQQPRIDEEHAQQQSRKEGKKEIPLPSLVRIEEIVKGKLPQLAVIAINVVMIASYEFVTISAYIAVVLIVIGEILGLKQTEHLNLRFILEILSKLLMMAWYVNLFTVPKPTPVR